MATSDWLQLGGVGMGMLDENNNIQTDDALRTAGNAYMPGLGSVVIDNDLEAGIAGLTGTTEALGAYRNIDAYGEGKLLGAAEDAVVGGLTTDPEAKRAEAAGIMGVTQDETQDDAAMAEIQALEQPQLPYGEPPGGDLMAEQPAPLASQTQVMPSPGTPQEAMDDVIMARQREGDSVANLHLTKAQGYLDRANELEKQSNAKLLEGERQAATAQAAQEHANAKLQEIQETPIDPMRAWNDAPIYGKVIAALFMMTGHPQVMNIVGKYMAQDLEAQKQDRNSQVSYWTTTLGDSRLGQKAAALKMSEGLAARMEQQRAMAGSEEEMAQVQVGIDKIETGNAELRAELHEGIAQGKLKADAQASMDRQREAQMAIARRDASVREGQLGVAQGRLGLERQKASDAKKRGTGATAKQLLEEMTASADIAELKRTGRTPKRNQEVRSEIARMGPQLTDTMAAMSAMEDVQAQAGLLRGKDGELVQPDDISGVGWWDSSVASNLSGGRQSRLDFDKAKTVAIEAFGRMQSGGVIGDEELVNFTKMVGNATNEKEFFSAQQALDRFLRQKMKNIRSSMSDEAASEYARNARRADASAMTGHGKPETGKLLTSKDRKRAKAKAILGKQ